MRLVFVTRRFWPLFGDAENAIENLSVGLRQFDCDSTILTARWDRSWSARFAYRGIPVIRLPNPMLPGWGRMRYQSSLGNWLREHQDTYDLVCVSRMRYCAATALDVARKTRKPVVVRVAGSGIDGDCQWHARSRLGGAVLARCRDAQAYCVPCLESKRELIESGCPPARVHLIAEGIQPVQLRESFTRVDARHALADINHDLQVPPDAPVVVCAGSLSERRGLKSLVSAWPAVLTQLPTARLWLIGDGPLRVELHQLRNDLEIGHAVHLPGTFDDLDGVLRAADLLVDPTADQPESQTVLQAVTARLPLVLATPAANGSVLRDDHTRRCEASDPTALSRAIIDGLQFPPDAAALSAARSRVLQQHDLGRMIRRYAELFQSVAAGSL